MKTKQGMERSDFHRWNNLLSPGETRKRAEEERRGDLYGAESMRKVEKMDKQTTTHTKIPFYERDIV